MNQHRARLLVLGLILTAVSCTSGTRSASGEGTIDLTGTHPEASSVPGWLNPKTLQIQPMIVKPEPGDMVVRGIISGGYFYPTGDIEGALHEAPPAGRTSACWLSVSDRSVHYQENASPPEPPYISGRFDPEVSLFYPEQTTIIR